MSKLPVVFLPHGGGPWPFCDVGFPRQELDALSGYLRTLPRVPATPPRALLVISAHWEERQPTVQTSAAPPLLYDYSGFPASAYTLTWPAPGSPQLAARVQALTGAVGDPRRGYDHGTFVPLKVAYPEAQIPTVQLSLVAGLDPAAHLALGRKLAPLRDEGVFIIGSGMSFHNMRGFGDPRSGPVSQLFHAWLDQAVTSPPAERDRLLGEWSQAPGGRASHPREEHLLPLMVAAGAAGDDVGVKAFAGTFVGTSIAAYHFGATPS